MTRSRSITYLVGVIAVVAIALTGCLEEETDSGGVRSVSGNRENPPSSDVDMARCYTDEFGYMQADMRVTNKSSKASTYFITVAFESPGGGEQFDTGVTSVNGLEAGQSTTVEAGSLTEAPADFTCRVAEVDRFAS